MFSKINELYYEFGLSSKEEYMPSLDEALITFGGKAYPKFGQVVILAGGAASGKGFVRSKLLGIEGIVLDVDRLKELVMLSTKFSSKIEKLYGIEVSKLNLKNKDDVSKLHDVVSKLHIPDKRIKSIFTSLVTADHTRLPNLIFDVTMKDMTKFHNIIRQVQDMGYWKKNISLVWVLNTIDVAISQNSTRSRTVAEEILMATHDGASYTMSKIIKMGDNLSNYLDGDIYVAFNNSSVDTVVDKPKRPSEDGKVIKSKTSKPLVVKEANYVQLKRKEEPIMKFEDISKDVITKIKRYVPNSEVWN